MIGGEGCSRFTNKSSGHVDDDGSTITTGTTNNTTTSSLTSSSSLPLYMTMMLESGLKFSYGTCVGHEVVTAHIPIDFRDGELVRQLYSTHHVYDYFDNCCGHVGFLKYDAGGEIRATNNNFGGG